MSTMSGGRAVVRALLSEGVRVAFGIPGVHNLDLYEGLRAQPELGHVLARHEQGAGFMADGFARATGEIPAVFTITGPGAINALTPIGQAYSDHSPVLLISTEVDSPYVSQERGDLHELRHQLGAVSGVLAWARRASSVDEIPWLVHEAVAYARQRSRPAYVEIPKDLLAAEGSPQFPGPAEDVRPAAEPAAVDRAASMLLAAERPLLHVGRGAAVSGAGVEVRELAETLGAPVLSSSLGKGVLPSDHPLSLGLVNWSIQAFQKELYAQSDLVLVVGTRLGPMSRGNGELPTPGRVIQIDLDPAAIGRGFSVELGLPGDARRVLGQLLASLRGRAASSRPEWSQRARDAYRSQLATWEQEAGRELRIIRSLRSALPPDGIVTNDMTVLCYSMLPHFPVADPRAFLFPFHLGALGFGLPAAIGAKFGVHERPVLAICGDGGFMFSVQELATAVKYGLSLVVLLCNDNCYNSVRRNQQQRFPGPPFEVDVANPDFMRLAQAFGVRGVRLGSLEEAGDAVRQSLDAPGVTIVEAPADLHSPL